MSLAVSAVALATATNNLRAARSFQLSAFVILIFDHFITFGTEVDRIWKKSFHFPTYLFMINRYVTPLMRIIIVVAFNDPNWPRESCRHFVRFSGGGTMVLVTIAEIIMILRVYALYCGNKTVLAILSTSLVGQIIVTAYSLVRTQAQNLPPGLHACVLVGKTGDNFFAAFWASSLCTDTLIFLFTLGKVFHYRRENVKIPLLTICARDGILYYFVIFAANLFNTVMYLSAPPGIKAIGASYSQLITATMISRLVLNLHSVTPSDPTLNRDIKPQRRIRDYFSTVDPHGDDNNHTTHQHHNAHNHDRTYSDTMTKPFGTTFLSTKFGTTTSAMDGIEWVELAQTPPSSSTSSTGTYTSGGATLPVGVMLTPRPVAVDLFGADLPRMARNRDPASSWYD